MLWSCTFYLLTLDNFDFTRKIVEKNLDEKLVNFLPVDNFDFTRKIVEKNLDEKLVKMLWS